jgi:hypothetical protein
MITTHTDYIALTAYGVEIPKALATRRAALAWAEANADRFPGCRIVQRTARGLRTVWRHSGERIAA